MLLRFVLLGSVLCLFTPSVLADEAADRDKIAGKWQPAAGEQDKYGIWTLEESDGTMRVTQVSDGKNVAEYECNTMGRECEVKEAGHPAKVSMWFNGPKLVEMRIRGSQVVKRRFHATGNGDTLELEVIPITPPGKSEVVKMIRLHVEAERKTQ